MKGKIFPEIQFKLVTKEKKSSFWEATKSKLVSDSLNSLNPNHKIGDILYLKEPYWVDSSTKKVFYRYDPESMKELKKYISEKEIIHSGFWKNKLYMPEKYARYFIKITGVRNDFLNNVDCRDCIIEGLPENKCHKYIVINKSGNKRVWVYDFVLIDDFE